VRIRVHWVILATVAALVVWATLPPDQVSLGKACEPATLRARLSRLIYGDTFWRAQLAALTAERDHLLMRMAHPEEDENGPPLENKMMRLAEGDHNVDPAEQQRQAEETRARRQERLAILMACQIQVERRLGQQ
jgi:hypothetical protein